MPNGKRRGPDARTTSSPFARRQPFRQSAIVEIVGNTQAGIGRIQRRVLWVVREQEGVGIDRGRQVIGSVFLLFHLAWVQAGTSPFLPRALLTLRGAVLFALFGVEEGQLS